MSVRAFNWAHKVLTGSPLTASQRLVLLGLCHHHHERTGGCFPSISTLGKYAGLSERRARTALRELEAMGLIKARKRTIGGRQRSSQYDLFGAFEGGRQRPPKTAVEGGQKKPPSNLSRGGTPASADREETLLVERKDPSQERKIIPFPFSVGRAV